MLKFKKYQKIIICGFLAAVIGFSAGCTGGGDDDELTVTTEPPVIEFEDEPEAVEEIAITPRFPQYVLPDEELVEPAGFRGNMWVVVGKNGYLYENGYINEYLGSAPKYINVTDEELIHRASTLKNIQEDLSERGIAFCVVITPSKAGSLPQFIPDFHIADFPPLSSDYVRPYIRFKQFLKDHGVYFVDSADVFASIGMTNTFPRTGIHWSLTAAFEVVEAVVKEYERQRGLEVRHLVADSIISSASPFAVEQDIFGIVYGGDNRRHMDDAIVDERYYTHDIYLEPGGGKPKIGRTIIQGGSFTGELNRFFGHFNLADSTHMIYYNNGGNTNRINWGRELRDVDFVLLEVNEQFVYNMGGNAPQWAENDINILPLGPNFIDALLEYLEN